MPLLPSTESSEQVVELLKVLLESLSAAARKLQYCVDCGSLLVHLDGHFWLEGDHHRWNVPLPFCNHCHPELATRLPFAA
jgi:hypothetical protein